MPLTPILLLIISIAIILITLRFKKADYKYKQPLRISQGSHTQDIKEDLKETQTNPFIIFNEADISRFFTINKGSVITDNYYIIHGTVDVFLNQNLIFSISQGSITFNCFDLLNINTQIKKIAASELRVAPLIAGNDTLNRIFIEKTLFFPAIHFFELTYQVISLENIKTKSFSDFLLKYFGYSKKVQKLTVKDEKIDLNEMIVWIEEGSVSIGGISFEKDSIIGYLGFFFNYKIYEGFGSAKIQYVNYSGLKKGVEFDSSFLQDIPEDLVRIGASSTWLRLPPDTPIVKKGYFPKEIFLTQNQTLGCKEIITEIPFQEDHITERIENVIVISGTLLDYFLQSNYKFFKKFTKLIFDKPKRKSKILLITPATEPCYDFVGQLSSIMDRESIVINKRNVFSVIRRYAVDKIGELLLSEYLFSLEKIYRVIIVYIENDWSLLLKLFSSMADIIFIVGNEPVPNRFHKKNVEFVQLYEERNSNNKKVSKTKKLLFNDSDSDEFQLTVNPGPTISHEKKDLSIDPLRREKDDEFIEDKVKLDFMRNDYPCYRRVHHILFAKKEDHGNLKDFERLRRYLLNERVGLVLGGGGARGFAHIGIIQALEEEGIPIDCVGGTSMGALIGALYAQQPEFIHVYTQAKKFAKVASSALNALIDFTFPFVSFFSGRALEKALKQVFNNSIIQNLWLEYYCVTTNLLRQEENIHFNGRVWKYVRASMSICGYLPPMTVSSEILVDGAYMNNVPADVMKSLNIKQVIAVDVGTYPDEGIDFYDTSSGLVLLYKKYFASKKYLSLSDIQYRLAFLSTEKKIKLLESETLLIRPDLYNYQSSDFKKFDEIIACGYEAAKALIKEWKAKGLIVNTVQRNRRSSI